MGQRIDIQGITFEIVDAPAPVPRDRPAFARPSADDPVAIAAWQAKTIPKNRRHVAEHLALWFGNECALCQQPVEMSMRHPHPGCANVDHIEPGGADIWVNVRLTHRSCNMQRGKLVLPEPSAALYASLLVEAISKYLDPDVFRPSAIWTARSVAALAEAARAMMAPMVNGAVERGTENGFIASMRLELAIAETRADEAIEKVRVLQQVSR